MNAIPKNGEVGIHYIKETEIYLRELGRRRSKSRGKKIDCRDIALDDGFIDAERCSKNLVNSSPETYSEDLRDDKCCSNQGGNDCG